MVVGSMLHHGQSDQTNHCLVMPELLQLLPEHLLPELPELISPLRLLLSVLLGEERRIRKQ
jgi:hypothetical protein